MRSHREYEEQWVVGEFTQDGRHVYMGWLDGICCCYGEVGDPTKAEKFETAKEAKHYLKTDEDAKEWYEQHPKAKVLRMVSGYTVYPPR